MLENNNQRKTGTVEGNTFKNLRSAINLDDDNSLVTLKNNNLLNCGTYFTYGGTIPPTQGAITLGNIFDMNNSNTLINNRLLDNNLNIFCVVHLILFLCFTLFILHLIL